MNARQFLDTNVLIYAFVRNDRRTPAAMALLEAGGTISVQILNEFVNVSRKKLARPWDEIERQLKTIRTLLDSPTPLLIHHHDAGISISRRYGFGIFDSLMIASALDAGCTLLYSEDLQHGQTVEGLTIKNPFTS